MEEMRVYVANLGKYNEGELVGDWFEPPIDYDEMAERIGLNEFYEEYAIHDYELPFEIDEYTPIEEVNRLCEMVEDLPEYIQDNLRELQGYFSSIEDLRPSGRHYLLPRLRRYGGCSASNGGGRLYLRTRPPDILL